MTAPRSAGQPAQETTESRKFRGHGQFRPGQSTFLCRGCGKRTRDVNGGNGGCELCRRCYDRAGGENYHSDEGHKGSFADCVDQYCEEARQ